MFLRPRREAGDEGWARPDISGVGAFATRERHVGCVRRRCQPVARRAPAHAGRCRHRTVQSRFLRTRERRRLRSTRACATRCNSPAPSRRPTGNSRPSRRGPSACATSMPTWTRSRATTPPFPGLADRVRVKISAPTAVLEFDTRDNVFTPTRGVYAESSWLASREALGASDDFERFQQVLIGWHPLAARRDARSARELRVVVGRHAVLPPAVRATARRARDALSGRPGGLGRGRGALAVLRPLERRCLRRRRHDSNRSARPSSPRRTSAAEAWASATSWQASSACTPASTCRAQPRDDRGVSRGGQCLVPAVIRCLSASGLAKSA